MVFSRREGTEGKRVSERIAAGEKVLVPSFWRHEILNALLMGEKRKRISPELTQAFIDDLNRLPIDVDAQATSATVFDVTQSLCRKHRLTAYDAAYLEIAMREGRALATVDDALRDAALVENVMIL